MKKVKLAINFEIDLHEVSGQANAVLGIRNSGKTYTAMKMAEGMMSGSIPIVVFDPSGTWKNIRTGVKGHKGFPVIVVGGDKTADFLLTAENAISIMRAAMRANISIIFDLYSSALANKSTWVKIVQDVVRVLMYENKPYGLRHLYFEEAAEFIPQRIQKGQEKVYSEIERLARIGRNASLGMTVINQRAEEINKAILELCSLVLLHKQVGKNSLISIDKWLKAIGYTSTKSITSSVSALKQGECFVINPSLMINDQDESDMNIPLIKVLPKTTFHPDPSIKPTAAGKFAKPTIDLSSFIKRLQKELEPKVEKETKSTLVKKEGDDKKYSALSDRYNKLSAEYEDLKNRSEIIRKRTNNFIMKEIESEFKQWLNSLRDNFSINLQKELSLIKDAKVVETRVFKHSESKISTKEGKQEVNKSGAQSHTNLSSTKFSILAAACAFPDGLKNGQLAVVAGMSPTSGTFAQYTRQLIASDYLTRANSLIYPTTLAVTETPTNLISDIPTNRYDIAINWIGILKGKQSDIWAAAIKELRHSEPNDMSIEDLADKSHMSVTSGTYQQYLRKIKRLGLL